MLDSINLWEFLLYFTSSFLFFISYYYCSKTIINNNKIKKFNRLFFTIFLPLLGSILHFFINIEFKIIIIFLLLILGINFVFKQNIKASIFISLLLTIFMFISELTVMILLVLIFQENHSIIMDNIFLGYLINITVALILYSIIIKSKDKINLTIDWYFSKKNISFFTTLFLIFISGRLLLLNNYYENQSIISFIVNSIIIIFIFYIMIVLVKEHLDKNNLENKLNFQKDHNKSYKKLVEDYGKKLHENNNDWTIVYGLIQFNNKKAKKFIESITNYKNELNDYWWLSSINNLKDYGLIMLIYYKFVELEEINININLGIDTVFSDYDKLNSLDIEEFNFIYKMIGVFLDNAIDSLKNTKEKCFNFEVYEEDDKFYFIIENSYEGIITEKSTKGKNRGYGLKLIEDLNKRFSNINYKTITNDNIFTQEIIIEFNNNKKD